MTRFALLLTLLTLLTGCAPCRCEAVRALRVGDRLAIIYADSLIDGSTAGTVLVPSGRAGEWVRDSTRRDK